MSDSYFLYVFHCFSLFLGPRANRSRRSRSVTFFHLSSLYTKEGPWGICSFSRANRSFALKIASNSLEKPKSEFPALLKTFSNLRQFPCLLLFLVQVFCFVMSNCLGQLYYASPPVSGGPTAGHIAGLVVQQSWIGPGPLDRENLPPTRLCPCSQSSKAWSSPSNSELKQ